MEANLPAKDQHGKYKPEVYDAIEPGYYDSVYEQGKGAQWFWHHHRFLNVFRGLPPSGARLLDVGCGPGTFVGHFSEGYKEAVGIDLAVAQIEYASKRHGATTRHFKAADIAMVPDIGYFDSVVSIEVIEHLPLAATQDFLKLCLKLLRPGGTLVLTTPNYRSFWPVIEWVLSKAGPVDYVEQHINRFTKARLERELEQAGFLVSKLSTFFLISPFLAAVSTKLATTIERLEQKLLPSLGVELLAVAQKPNE